MNQKNTIVLVVVLFAAAAFIGGYLFRGVDKVSIEPTPAPSVVSSPTAIRTTLPTATTVPKPKLYSVYYSATGISAPTLTIRAGDAVRFRNDGSSAVWPASDPHPSHDGCPGFDAGRSLGTGEEYTLTFPTARTCTYHNHLDPLSGATRGTIIVQ